MTTHHVAPTSARASSTDAAAFLALPPGWGVRGRRPVAAVRDGAVATLRELRAARFHAGLCCVYCSRAHVQRWGTFSGRQRYRCRDCARSFSDLTGTPLAYSKRPELWKAFASCMLESLSVRAAGRRLGIAKDTAWRWRHALLDGHGGPGVGFGGIVETLERNLPLNRKGQRGLLRPRRRAPARRAHGCVDPSRVWILFAHDRAEGSGALVVPGHRPRSGDYEALIQPERSIRTLLSPFGAFAPGGMFAISRGVAFARLAGENRPQPPGALLHLEHVLRYERGFSAWLRRFRGVGSSYLENYLAWYRFLESLERPPARLLFGAVRGSVAAAAAPAPDVSSRRAPTPGPTLPADTAR